jgi:hypothetical protein
VLPIVRKPERTVVVHYERFFEYQDAPGRGFAFPCDPEGGVDLDRLTPKARENYVRCTQRILGVFDRGVRRIEYSHFVPALGLCECNSEIPLDEAHNICTGCGRAYDGSGKLVPPPQPELDDPLSCWQEDVAALRV